MSDAASGISDLDKSKKTREIKELKVNELSMVDRPAILREFLVVKRQQEESMGAFAQDNQDASTSVEKALPSDLKTAITAVVNWMKKGKAGDGAPTKDIDRVASFLGKIGDGKYPYPKPESMSKSDGETDEEKKKKEEEEAKAKACASDKKDESKKSDALELDDEENKKKSAGDGGLTVTISQNGDVSVSGQAISKGKSQFTSDRTTSLKDAVHKLIGMLADVDKESARNVVDDLLKAQLPGEVKWTPGTVAIGASVTKQLTDALEPIAKRIEDLSQRFETIEKSRPAPKSTQGDSTYTTGVTKSQDERWSGLPLPRG